MIKTNLKEGCVHDEEAGVSVNIVIGSTCCTGVEMTVDRMLFQNLDPKKSICTGHPTN